MTTLSPQDAHILSVLNAALCRQPLALAYSGGLDSRFVAFAARRAGGDVLLLHAIGPHIPQNETNYAMRWALEQGLRCLPVPVDPLTLPGVVNNSRQRCYVCKQELFARLRETLQALGEDSRRLCDGTHAGDLQTWRPGLQALREAKVWSPLAEAGLEKATLRRLACACGMDVPEQRARPCLLTRLAYGLSPDAATLARVAAAEQAVAAVLCSVQGQTALATVDFRLRLTPAPVLQCVALPLEQREAVEAALAAHGFAGAELREEAEISGFFDRL